MRNVIALILVVTLLSAPSAYAAPGTGPDGSITNRSASPGPLATAAAREASRLALSTDALPLSATQQTTVTRGWAARHPVLLGTLLGGVGGGFLGAVWPGDPAWRGVGIVVFTTVGTGFGALAGVVVKEVLDL